MTAVLPRASSADRDLAMTVRQPVLGRERIAVGVLAVVTAALYLWNLGGGGWANAFYSAAAQAGAANWTAMLFGSSDASNAITVDKTPAALWVMDVSVRMFGLHPWSVLLPQALAGVAAVLVLYATVRRSAGPAAALLAGSAFALTPVSALIFRFNNPDALLVLTLVVAAYCVQRAVAPDAARWWMVAAGTAVGIGFLAKMMQAFLVLPGLGIAYLVCAAAPLRTRLLRSVSAVAALVVAAGWYLVLVELWPASARPYIGGSQHDSIIELALGYNGFGRLSGNETGGLGNLDFDVGWGRLFGPMMGTHVAWLLPAAVVGLAAGLIVTRNRPRNDPTRAGLLIWGGWLAVTAVTFSFAGGILHPYYTIALAPAVAACAAIGSVSLWRNRNDVRAAAAMSATIVVTVVLAAVLLANRADWLPWLRGAVVGVGLAAAVSMLVVARLPRRVAVVTAVLAIVACLAAPTVYAVVTAANPHRGAIPSVGPQRGGGGFGGMFDSPTPAPEVAGLLSGGGDRYRWSAAVVGSSNAAGYQLAAGRPVMAVGGFNGTDPAPTLGEFQELVADRQIHYFIGGHSAFGGFGGRGGKSTSGSRAASDIADWVESRYAPIWIGDAKLYDLTAPPRDS